MTNQEPGAPEPLATVAGWLWNAYHADEHEGPRETCPETLCRKARAALSHPESDTREDADLEAWRQFTMDLADGKVSEKPNGLVREAFAYAWNAAHPESDTRGLDVERLADMAVMALGEVTTGAAYGLYHKSFREHFIARLGRADAYKPITSPDLSIDREGRCGCGHFAPTCDLPPAIRGTSQPEPTE